MRKPVFHNILTLLLMVFAIAELHAQTVEFTGSGNFNSFFDTKEDDGPNRQDYDVGFGYSFSLAKTGKIDSFPYRLEVRFDDYNGSMLINTGSVGSFSELNVDVNKKTLGVAFYPYRIAVVENLSLNVGVDVSYLLQETYDGEYVHRDQGLDALRVEPTSISSEWHFALCGRLEYNVMLKDQWFAQVFYRYYFGVLYEFDTYDVPTQSMRHNFGFGVGRKLN